MKHARIVYLYVLDEMADWEASYAIAELNTGRYFKPSAPRIVVKTVADTKRPPMTQGGVHIKPDITVQELQASSAAMLILPGGDAWLKPERAAIIQKVKDFLAAGVPVAAICGATVALANAGIFNARRHTSNTKTLLERNAINYSGSEHYIDELVVVDGALITAQGTAPLQFARAILEKLDVMSGASLNAWYSLYDCKQQRYFDDLAQSLPDFSPPYA